MTAHVSYLGLMKVQAKPVIGRVVSRPVSITEMLERTKAAKKALGMTQAVNLVDARLIGRKDAQRVANLVLPPPAPVVEPAPEPIVIVVTQSAVEAEEERTPFARLTPWKRILEEVCEKYGISRVDILSDRRSQKYVIARHEAMYRMRHETTMSYPAIGRRLGGKDHTSVMHGIKRHMHRMEAGLV